MTSSPRTWFALVLVVGTCFCPRQAFCQGSAHNLASGIRYTVSLAAYQDHLLRVELELPPGSPTRQVQLPVWNALYQVRDFSQYVNWLRAKASSGDVLAVR